jgi:hypothetical protein
MGRDIYAGPLAPSDGRWLYPGPDGRATGVEPPPLPSSLAGDRGLVPAWRDRLSRQLRTELRWDEAEDRDYYMTDLASPAYCSVLLLAASVEGFRVDLPERSWYACSMSDVWQDAAREPNARFRHVYWPDLWLPTDLPVFTTVDWTGENWCTVGSSSTLLANLREIDERTFRLAGTRFVDALTYDFTGNPTLDDAMRHGLATMLWFAERAVEEDLPLQTGP